MTTREVKDVLRARLNDPGFSDFYVTCKDGEWIEELSISGNDFLWMFLDDDYVWNMKYSVFGTTQNDRYATKLDVVTAALEFLSEFEE